MDAVDVVIAPCFLGDGFASIDPEDIGVGIGQSALLGAETLDSIVALLAVEQATGHVVVAPEKYALSFLDPFSDEIAQYCVDAFLDGRAFPTLAQIAQVVEATVDHHPIPVAIDVLIRNTGL